jgi:hypothetical protein
VAGAWLYCRAEFRGRWRSWLALALLIAVSAGAVLFTLAGARRTSTVWDRLAARTNAHDAFVIGQQFDFDLDAVARLPEVADSVRLAYVAGSTDVAGPYELTPLVSQDGGFLGRIDRPKVIEGRRPDPDQPHEVGITPPVAEEYDLDVGSTIVLRGFTPEEFFTGLEGAEFREPTGPEVRLRVVAIEVSANEGELVESVRSGDNIHLTPAFADRYRDRIGMGPALAVRLHRGDADQSRFKLGVERLAAGRPVQLTTQDDEGSQVRHSIGTQQRALELFALLAAVAGVLAVGQALSRQAFVDRQDGLALRALGMTRPQRWAAGMVRTALISVAAAAAAVALSVVASPLMPFGVARLAEPSPGVRLDGALALGGLAAIPLVSLVLAAWPGWRAARASSATEAEWDTPRSPGLSDRLARTGLPPTVVAGVRLAIAPGRGRTAAPTRSAILGTAFSLSALTTALAFGASMDRLASTPRLYGWNWDTVVGNPFTRDLAEEVIPVLRASSAINGYSAIAAAEVDVGGVRTQAYGFDTLEGQVLPPVVDGRAPRAPDEIVVGTSVRKELGRGLGDRVDVRVADTVASFRIVGVAVFAQLSIFEIEALGRGALVTGDGLRQLVPEAQRNVFAFRWAEGVDRDAARRALAATLGQTVAFSEAEPPHEIADVGRVDGMPAVLAAVVAVMALASVVHALATTVRRRRRDLAILKTLGFVRSQLRAVVAWQATTITVLALALGLPAGARAGQWAWDRFAESLGVVAEPAVPVVAILVAVPVSLVVANLVAAIPGRAAARTPAALVLRSE